MNQSNVERFLSARLGVLVTPDEYQDFAKVCDEHGLRTATGKKLSEYTPKPINQYQMTHFRRVSFTGHVTWIGIDIFPDESEYFIATVPFSALSEPDTAAEAVVPI